MRSFQCSGRSTRHTLWIIRLWQSGEACLAAAAGCQAHAWKGIALDYREGYYARPNDGSVRSNVVAATPPPSNAPSLALQQAMGLGAPTPDDVVFEATVQPEAAITRDAAGSPAPQGNFLAEPVRMEGYRNINLHYAVRADQLTLIASADKTAYAEKLEVVTVVYDSVGKAVNSKRSAVSVNFDGPDDPRLQKATVTANLTTQVPAKGDYFLRVGVHDLGADKVGALELPVNSIKPVPETTPAVGAK